jgi:hypothetical protein
MLAAALSDDWDGALATLKQINDECGGDGIAVVMIGLCDTVISKLGIPCGPVQIEFQAADGDGRVTGADEVQRPEVVWAGRMLGARAADDLDTWNALLVSVPEEEFACHVGALLEMSTLMIASALDGGGSTGEAGPDDQ